MGKSVRLRVGEVRAAVRLAGECRELGHDPSAWPTHLLAALRRLVDAPMRVVGEVMFVGTRLIQVPTAHVGWPERLTAEYLEAWARGGVEPDNPAVVALVTRCGRRGAATRRDVIADREWEVSPFARNVLRPFGLEEGVVSGVRLSGGRTHIVACSRSASDRRFDPRDRDLLHLVHAELAPHLGAALAVSDDPAAGLTPRLRQVWLELLGGDPEKRIAARLSLSPNTLHGYVVQVYRAFAVGSRAELMARCLRRRFPPGKPPPG